MAGGLTKTITRISPSAVAGLEESERHYVDVHFPLARELLATAESIRSYHTAVVRRQRDEAGGWELRPQAWRFITLRFTDPAGTSFSPELQRRFSADVVHCLRDLRRTYVDERVVLDRLEERTAISTYLIELDRDPSTPLPAARDDAGRLVDALSAAAAHVPGIRRVVLNTVLREAVAVALREEGQLLTADFQDETNKVAYVEVIADDVWWGARLFEAEDVAGALTAASALSYVGCYEISERCGFDRR